MPGKRQFDLMVDSGAYSAWKLGKAVNLKEYCVWLTENMDWIDTYVSLDVIIPEDPEAAARQSFENWQAMRTYGLPDAIPVFHARESFDWIKRYLDAGCKYLGIAATSLRGGTEADKWQELVWANLTDSGGRPIIKTHAFGEGREHTLSRFPWYSADSSSWVFASRRNGSLHLPDGKQLSFRNDRRSRPGSMDVGNLEGLDLEHFNEFLKDRGLSNDPFKETGTAATYVRMYLCAAYYLDMERRVNLNTPVQYRGGGFFVYDHGRTGFDIPDFKFNLAFGSNPFEAVVLAVAGATRGLASYFYVKNYALLKPYVYNPIKACVDHPRLSTVLYILEEYLHAEH